jgi:hypothetical protein
MNCNFEEIWKETGVAYWRYYLGIFLERLRKATRNLSEDSRWPLLNKSSVRYP